MEGKDLEMDESTGEWKYADNKTYIIADDYWQFC